jgi:hypothetical protein
MPDRLPLRPPPKALHYVAPGYITLAPLCGKQGDTLHLTTNLALVTCPKCRRLLGGTDAA